MQSFASTCQSHMLDSYHSARSELVVRPARAPEILRANLRTIFHPLDHTLWQRLAAPLVLIPPSPCGADAHVAADLRLVTRRSFLISSREPRPLPLRRGRLTRVDGGRCFERIIWVFSPILLRSERMLSLFTLSLNGLGLECL